MNFFTGDPTYDLVLKIAYIWVALVTIGGMFGTASYGRFPAEKLGIQLSPRFGWMLMELPASVTFIFFYFQGENRFETVPLFFLGIWILHYSNRGFIFPFLIRAAKGSKGTFGLSVVLAGWFTTALHGYLNAALISDISTRYTVDWFSTPQFIIGLVIYLIGYTFNIHSDAIVRNLRSKEEVERGEKVYRIPEGGLFKYVSNPSYLTELIAWTGFATMIWSPGALFILLISAANLIPRAFQTHKWYLEKFPEYPKNRKVIFPFIL